MLTFSRALFLRWWRLDISQLSAAITYYTIFSLTPLLVIAIGVAGTIFGSQAAQGEILVQVENILGERGTRFFERTIENTANSQTNLITPLISLLMLGYGASGAFTALRNALNKIFGETDGKHPLVGYIQGRILSLLMVLIISGLLLLSLLLSSLLHYLARFIDPVLPASILNLRWLNEVIAFLAVTFMLAFVYKFLPDTRPPWKFAFQGAVFASLFYNLGKFLIAYYLGVSNVGSIYGTAGTVMLLLIWIYYSVQILLIGAIFTQLRLQALPS